MKLQRSTLLLVATALVLGGAVVLTEVRPWQNSDRPETATGEAAAAPIYDFEETAVVRLQIETPGQAVTFERDEAGFWQMTNPEQYPAEEAAIAFLLSRLTTDGLLQTTTVDAANQAEFGLDVPFATLELTLEDGTTHSLALGDADFTGKNYYALIDPASIPLSKEAGEVSVAIVSENILNGIDRPLEEWQAVVDSPTPAASEEALPEAGTPDAPENPEAPAAGEADPAAEPSDETGATAEPETLPPEATEPIPVPVPESSAPPP